MKIALDTLGCKLNQAETEALARELLSSGQELVTQPENADIFVLFTCTVTHTADAKARHLLNRVRRCNPGILIVATGCYAQREPAALEKLADIVVDNRDKATLSQKLMDLEISQRRTTPVIKTEILRRTRSFVKIQDGCNHFCAYCIVPHVRQGEKSQPLQEIVKTINKLESEGYQEIVLTGTRIGGYQDHGKNLADLIQTLLSRTAIKRFRLSSLQPQEIKPELLSLWADKRLCPHFHLSLQSGSDTVLKRMNRRYTTGQYAGMVEAIRRQVPEAAITTDVIVGFPGETDAEFEESLDFCRRMEFARLHVFIFSPRTGTAAAVMPEQVDEKVKKHRSQMMLAVAEENTRKFREKFRGNLLDVLWEKVEDGVWSGVTGNYIRVYKKDDQETGNRIGTVLLD